MKKKKTRTTLFTPAGKTVQTIGIMMLFAAIFGFLLTKLNRWSQVDTNWFMILALSGYNVWLLGEVLCLYGGHWSKRTRVWLIITTVVISIPLLLIIMSFFWVECASYILLILLIGNILEYRVAGKIRKEVQQANGQSL